MSPSARHEVPIDLIRRNPELVELLMRFVLDYNLPKHSYIKVRDSNLSPSLEYFADLVLALEDEEHRPVASIVFENQLTKNIEKRASWPGYIINERKRSGCPTLLVVLVPDDKTEQWALQPIETGHPGFLLKPLVVNMLRVPKVTQANIKLGEQFPELAVLSSLAHGNRPGGAEVVATTLWLWSRINRDDSLIAVYSDYVWSTLTDEARKAVEAAMNFEGYEFKSDFAKKYHGWGLAQGEARGETRGEAKGKSASILAVLDARGLVVGEAARAQIASTTDIPLLNRWLTRSIQIRTVDELFEVT